MLRGTWSKAVGSFPQEGNGDWRCRPGFEALYEINRTFGLRSGEECGHATVRHLAKNIES